MRRPQKTQLTIAIGSMSPPFREQLEQQGCTWKDSDELDHLQRDASALVRLKVRGLITEDAYRKAGQKVSNKVAKLATAQGEKA